MKQLSPQFRAEVHWHNSRGAHGLCIGGFGYTRESSLVIPMPREERIHFPVRTLFDLQVVESSRGIGCVRCFGSGDYFDGEGIRRDCPACNGRGRQL